MKKLHLKVTEQDIAFGSRADGFRCPIAQTLLRTCPTIGSFYVYSNRVEIGREYFPLPEIAHDLIKKFDNGLHAEPIEFDIEVPDTLECVS